MSQLTFSFDNLRVCPGGGGTWFAIYQVAADGTRVRLTTFRPRATREAAERDLHHLFMAGSEASHVQ